MATEAAERRGRVRPATMLAGVRADPIVGRESCSVVNEWSDEDVLIEIADAGDTRQAVAWMRIIHRTWEDVGRHQERDDAHI